MFKNLVVKVLNRSILRSVYFSFLDLGSVSPIVLGEQGDRSVVVGSNRKKQSLNKKKSECNGSIGTVSLCPLFWAFGSRLARDRHRVAMISKVILAVGLVGTEGATLGSTMVNTRSRPEGQEADIPTADHPLATVVGKTVRVSNVLGGGPEHIPRRNLEADEPIIEEVTAETRMMDRMMLAMNMAMAQQQEVFLKLLEDRDANNRRHETVGENVIVAGSGGTGPVISPVLTATLGVSQATRSCTFKTFLGCRQPEFKGSDNPLDCMAWVREMEQAFRSSKCGEEQRVIFGSRLLRGIALTWWDVYSTSLEPAVLDQLSWSTFKKKLLEEYCNERSLDRIKDEFQNLKKGGMSVREYNRLFMDKLGFVGLLVPTEKDKIKAYIKGLPSDMMSMVRVTKTSTLREAMEEAQLMEDAYSLGRDKSGRQVEKRKWEGSSMPSKKPFYANNNAQRGADPRRDAKWCSKCRSKHFGPCNFVPGMCYKCGKTGHMFRDCPLKGQLCFECKEPGHVRAECPKLKTGGFSGKKMEPPRSAERDFQMTSEEAKASTDVVSGTFFLNSVPTHVLFDSGASYSFISDLFCQRLAMSKSMLENAVVVEIANGGQVLIHNILKDCILELKGKKFPINLLPMQIGGFDVVVGMDWLSKNQAEIVCSKKMIRLPVVNGEGRIIYGEGRKGDVAIISGGARVSRCVSGRLSRVAARSCCGLSYRPHSRSGSYCSSSLSFGSYRNARDGGSTPGPSRERFHQNELVTLGSSGPVRQEKRRCNENVYRLQGTEQSDGKEQVSTSENRRFVRSTSGNRLFLKDRSSIGISPSEGSRERHPKDNI
ncbi:hypothetical protein L6452_28637 [Arctium lappa]|uniref:Uncharacterized protein n=1 Tax=Arctium lappa TaxID=4217 RepID=A0ACB8ZY33_ARCLA|nr:hypothetical protein L6452_28637 [Arctium lappa]